MEQEPEWTEPTFEACVLHAAADMARHGGGTLTVPPHLLRQAQALKLPPSVTLRAGCGNPECTTCYPPALGS